MYSVKIFYKDIDLNDKDINRIKEYFAENKSEEFKDFHYYHTFHASDLSNALHADINIWVVNSEDETKSDEHKYIIKFYSVDTLLIKFHKLMHDIKELFKEEEIKYEQKKEIPKISGNIRISIVDMMNYFIGKKEDIELLAKIKSDPNFSKLEQLFDMLSNSHIQAEVLESLVNNIEEIDLNEFFEIVKNHAKLGNKYNIAVSDNSLDMTVGGKTAAVGTDAVKAKQSIKGHTTIGNINPFHGLFK